MVDYIDQDYITLTQNNITYNTNTAGSNQLNLYRPSELISISRPVFIWVHGGGFTQGTKDNQEAVLICQEFASRGYKSVTIDYRLGSFENAARDTKAAVRWVKDTAAVYGFNTNRIIVGGDSAGALAAYASIGHPTLEELNGSNGFFGNSKANALVGCWGPYLAVGSTSVEPYSTAITNGDFDISFLVHGNKDTIVPHAHTELLTCAIRRRSVLNPRVYKQTLLGADHSAWFPISTAQGFYNSSIGVLFPYLKTSLGL